MLAGRLVWREARWADLAAKEVSARLASVLLLLIESEGVVTPERYRIPRRYTHGQIASMIGANRESTTRAFGKLQEEGGGVRRRNRYIYVTDVEGNVNRTQLKELLLVLALAVLITLVIVVAA